MFFYLLKVLGKLLFLKQNIGRLKRDQYILVYQKSISRSGDRFEEFGEKTNKSF